MGIFANDKKPGADIENDKELIKKYFINMFDRVCIKNEASVGVAAAVQTLKLFDETLTKTNVSKQQLNTIFMETFEKKLMLSEDDLNYTQAYKQGILAYKGYVLAHRYKFDKYIVQFTFEKLISEQEKASSNSVYENYYNTKLKEEQENEEKRKIKEMEKIEGMRRMEERRKIEERRRIEEQKKLEEHKESEEMVSFEGDRKYEQRKHKYDIKPLSGSDAYVVKVVLIAVVLLIIIGILIVTKPWVGTSENEAIPAEAYAANYNYRVIE